jgi:hypothetical protein
MGNTSPIRRPWGLDDATIDAIVDGRPVAGELEAVVAFARQVRMVAVDPTGPTPSAELARILRGEDTTIEGSTVKSRRATILSRAAGLGVAAKIAIGAGAAAAGVTGAGALGALPASANHAVRHAIETVAPVDFGDDRDRSDDHRRDDQAHNRDQAQDDHPTTTVASGGNGEHPDNFGATVSKDARGETDGQKGVDGQVIREENPGSQHRPPTAIDHTPPTTQPTRSQADTGHPAPPPGKTNNHIEG